MLEVTNSKNTKNGDADGVGGNGKVYFVTGADGRIGRTLIPFLLKHSTRVNALVTSKNRILNLPRGSTPYVGTLNDTAVLDEACAGVDTIFHLAGNISSYKSPIKELINSNVTGVKNVIEAAERHGVKHFIFASSIDVYGSNRKDVLTENSKLRPTDPYGYSKMLAEDAIIGFKTVPYTIFRIATIYGPNFEGSFFKVFSAIKSGSARIVGNGKNRMPLIHIYDVMQAFMLADSKEASKYNIYNLSDGNIYTQEYLFNLAADLLNVPRPTKRISLKFLAKLLGKYKGLDSDELRFLLSNRTVDISKIKQELGFNPLVNIVDGAKEIIKKFSER
ncbi:MAG: NAD(P)-dependent oxidoreductase [Candidatus Micrarchaeaceae archaeon]